MSLLMTCLILVTPAADDPQPPISDLFMAVTQVVLEHHMDPPTRQQMLLTGIKGMYTSAEQPLPPHLSRQISKLDSDQAMQQFAHAKWQELVVVLDQAQQRSDYLLPAFVQGMLGSSGPAAEYFPAREYRVREQLRENLYEGIGIQLAQQDGRPLIVKTFPGGPAREGGVQDGDLILSVDGTDTANLNLTESVQLLRGRKGEPLVITVTQPGDADVRELRLVRDVIPFQTIKGWKQESEEGDWTFRLDKNQEVVYLSVDAIRGSTVSELQQIARRLQDPQPKGLILDLRNCREGDVRFAAMLADQFLSGGEIGQVQTVGQVRSFPCRDLEQFRGVPMAVLVNESTAQVGEWLAAALQDRDRAVLVGSQTAGVDIVLEDVELPLGLGGVQIWTGQLRRTDGAPLQTKTRQPREADSGSLPQGYLSEEQILVLQARRAAGVEPDVVVTKGAGVHADPVVDKAVELLTAPDES